MFAAPPNGELYADVFKVTSPRFHSLETVFSIAIVAIRATITIKNSVSKYFLFILDIRLSGVNILLAGTFCLFVPFFMLHLQNL